ncbi:SURF1 family protein [Labrenzia suaedae]|uniref:SURF1-like protein n=1 Tax=Roseibium litorale TaxID=2803841 RepID=A0ABR9CQ67_9HYPH|nr:SURF1 family protein [Roseibium litorale]
MRQLLFPTIAAGTGLVILLNLGMWQVHRLAWKEALIAHVAADVTKPAVAAPGPDQWDNAAGLDDADYRHVEVTGHYIGGSAYYYTSLADAKGRLDGPGYLLYSPFETREGWRVMINRGFVPQGLAAADIERLETVPEGDVTLTGLLRKSEKPNWTTPAVDKSKRIWFARDTDDMADVIGIGPGDLAPYSIDLDAQFTGEDGLPQAGETIVQFKNDHLGYALTWFGLAATLAGVYLAYAVSLWRKPQD